jgi:hypothetical protein
LKSVPAVLSRIYSFSSLFKAGHRIQLEIMCNEPLADAFAQLLPPDSYLPGGRATSHKIVRDARHPSRLLLPVIPTERVIREPAYRSIHSSSPSSTRQSILFAR